MDAVFIISNLASFFGGSIVVWLAWCLVEMKQEYDREFRAEEIIGQRDTAQKQVAILQETLIKIKHSTMNDVDTACKCSDAVDERISPGT